MLAFGAVLLLFGLALVVMVVALARIADAESDVTRLDRAKHAGHQAAGLAREQYIHQAHTLLEWNDSHLSHYDEVASEARIATERLSRLVPSPEATQIASLVAESDRRFRGEVVPAIAAGRRDRVPELHAMTERPVETIVALNDALNRSLDTRADAAQARAESIRSSAKLTVLICFALAIVLAMAVGLYLMRSISRPVAALRAGALRIGAGDLSARVTLPGEDEFADLARVFDRMAEDLARHQTDLLEAHRLASIGQVASGVAHEINNPLGVILGYLSILRREPALADRDELRIIDDETRQCQAIVAGLLDLARPVRLRREEVELGEVARDAVARLEESGRCEGVTLEIAERPPVLASADEGKLRQIVLNLVGNALDAARDPAATATRVALSWERQDGRAMLHVDDDGPGVPPGVAARIFEPFFTTRSRGHGLGLAIARTLARAHGGDVALTARAGAPGTRATVWLPTDDHERITP